MGFDIYISFGDLTKLYWFLLDSGFYWFSKFIRCRTAIVVVAVMYSKSQYHVNYDGEVFVLNTLEAGFL